ADVYGHDAALAGPARPPDDVDALRAHEPGDRVEAARAVVVAGHDDGGQARLGGAPEELVHGLLGLGAGVAGVEQVPGHQDDLGAGLQPDLEALQEGFPDLGRAVVAVEGLARVPVAGVEDAHRHRLTPHA